MSQTATITPTVPVRELWEATAPVTGDYARDCAELAREALSHVGFTGFEETPFEDVLACREGNARPSDRGIMAQAPQRRQAPLAPPPVA